MNKKSLILFLVLLTISVDLSGQRDRESSSSDDTGSELQTEYGDSLTKNNTSSSNWPLISSVLFAISTAGLAYITWNLWVKKKNTEKTINSAVERVQSMLGENITSSYRQQESSISKLSALIVQLSQNYFSTARDKQEIVKLRQDIEFLKQTEKALIEERDAISDEFQTFKDRFEAFSKRNEVSIISETQESNPAQSSEKSQVDPPSIFFLSYPSPTNDGKGEFYDKRQNQPNQTNTYYEFLLTSDPTMANFSFYDTPGTVEGATRNPDTYLNPACNYDAVDPKAKHIRTVVRGSVVKVGDVWKVQDKAKIEFY